jgi:hypothetical protein
LLEADPTPFARAAQQFTKRDLIGGGIERLSAPIDGAPMGEDVHGELRYAVVLRPVCLVRLEFETSAVKTLVTSRG